MTNLNQYIVRTVKVGDTIISDWNLPEGITLSQEIQLREKLIRFTIFVKNTGSTAQTVDLRYLWDVQIADNDGAPYTLPDGSTIVKEIEYISPPFSWWAAMDRPQPETTLTIFGSWVNRPNKLQFVYWEHVFGSFEFDYTVDPNFAFYDPPHTTYPESDSAVVMYWTGITLGPGQETNVASYYGKIKTPFPQKLERGTKASILSKKVLTLVPLNEREDYSSASVWSKIIAATAATTWFDDMNIANYRPLLYVNMSNPQTTLDPAASKNYYLYPVWNFSQTFYKPDLTYIVGSSDIPGITGTKIAGQYEVATTFWASSPGAIIVTDYASGLSACPLAAYVRWPIFYLDPSQDIPTDFNDAIKLLKPTDADVFYTIIVSSSYADASLIETKLRALSVDSSIAPQIILIDSVNTELVYQIKLYETYPQMNYIVVTNSADLDQGQLRGTSLAAGQLAAYRKAAILDVSRIKLPNDEYFSPSMISYGDRYNDNLGLNGILDSGESVDYVKAIWDAERELVDALKSQGVFAVTDHERATGNSQRFVAIVGSSTAVPFKVCHIESGDASESDYILTDNLYAQFDYSSSDDVDHVGLDAAVGRILTLDPADASMQIARSLAYHDLIDTSWQKNTLITGIYFRKEEEWPDRWWLLRTAMEAANLLDDSSGGKISLFYLFDVNTTILGSANLLKAAISVNPLEYLGGKFTGAGQEGRQITVPVGTEVDVWVHVNNTFTTPYGDPLQLDGELKVEVKKDIIWGSDQVYTVFTKEISLDPLQDMWFNVGSFSANDETGALPTQVREYFIKVYFNDMRIYDPTDPNQREWVKTGTPASTTDSTFDLRGPFGSDSVYDIRPYDASTVYNERDPSVAGYPDVDPDNSARMTSVNLATHAYNKLLVLVYTGHGVQKGFTPYTNPIGFDTSDAEIYGSHLYTSSKFSFAPSYIWTEACLTARLARITQYLPSWKDSLALQLVHLGAAVYIGSTGLGYPGPYDEMTISNFKYVAEGYPAGIALWKAKQEQGNANLEIRHKRQIIILGDPAFRVAIPDPPEETVESSDTTSCSQNVSVSISRPSFNNNPGSFVTSINIRADSINTHVLSMDGTRYTSVEVPGASLAHMEDTPIIPYITIRYNNIPRGAVIKDVRLAYIKYADIPNAIAPIWTGASFKELAPRVAPFRGFAPLNLWSYAIEENDFTTGYTDAVQITVNFAQFNGARSIIRIVYEFGFEIEYENPAEIVDFDISKSTVNPAETVSFDVTVNNVGTRTLTCTGEIAIYDQDDILVQRLFTDTVQIQSNTLGCLSARWRTPSIPQGEYTAVAIVYYSDGEAGPRTLSFNVVIDEAPPTTIMQIGTPNHIAIDMVYVTPETPFTLIATDNPDGSGVATTWYRIRNTTFASEWTLYLAPFNLSGLADGIYTLDFYSIDNAGNMEPSSNRTVTLFSWNYIFTDSYGRGTILKINMEYKFFQFIAPDEDCGIRNSTYMRVYRRTIIICHKDDEVRMIALAVDTKLDFCIAIAWDVQTRTRYFLIDKMGTEE